ncbi:hypothetical protein ABZ330_31300 [Streptomyces sp. NPDC006172]|uniref:hypothetical protein n=1 Tax=Streptomyces sp. NPDC006172 TaxID=3154470 RepID=UPI0033DC0344
MSEQPYRQGQGYEGENPYAEPQHQQQQPQQQAWPGQQQYGYDDQQAHLQYTQEWQGQTWETSVQPQLDATDAAQTAYLPPQTGEAPAYCAAPQPGALPPETGASPVWQQQSPYGAQQPPHTPVQGNPYAPESGEGHGSAYGPAAEPAHGANHAAYGAGHAAHGAGHAVPVGAPGQPPVGVPAGPPQPAAPDASARDAAAPATTPDASEGDGRGYGPATLAGNARVTDAQRARLEGRSPIIEPGMQPAALTALLGLLLSTTAAVGTYALLVPVVVLQAVTAAGWFRLNGMWPARQGIALAFLGALAADGALLVAGRENAPAAILGTLGVWVLLCLVLQLRSHADPDERMYGLMATVASAALAIIATGHLGADPDAVTVGAAAVAVAALARALPLPTPVSVVVSLLAAAGAGIAVGGMTGFGAKGALLGAGAAVCALIGHRVASYDYPSRFVHFTAGVALPLAAAAPAVYVLGRALA